jgi:hypothetical protein
MKPDHAKVQWKILNMNKEIKNGNLPYILDYLDMSFMGKFWNSLEPVKSSERGLII